MTDAVRLTARRERLRHTSHLETFSGGVLEAKELSRPGVTDEELLDNDVVLGYDSDGKVVSMEILDASRKGLLNVLVELARARKEAVEPMLSKIS